MWPLKLDSTILATAALMVIPAYTWISLYHYWKKLKQDYEQAVLFQKRHNCVITYQANKGLAGWPPNVNRCKGSCVNLFEDLYEPILYFIRTAQKSLDVAVMLINVKSVYTELIRAHKRGVQIRVLFNFQHADSSRDQIKNLLQAGIECQFYCAPSSTLDSIMHNKYIVKDYSKDCGYVCTGSMNFSQTSVLNNYESFVFMSSHSVVEAFKNNFENCWKNISSNNAQLDNFVL